MSAKKRYGGKWVLDTAIDIFERLRHQREGTLLKLRRPSRFWPTETGGWMTIIGRFGAKGPILEVWFDLYSGHTDRKLYAGFHSFGVDGAATLADQVSKELWPVRHVRLDEVTEKGPVALIKKIAKNEFSKPIIEDYGTAYHDVFFGFYDPTRATSERINSPFCERASAFFLDVAHCISTTEEALVEPMDFPQSEDRKKVAAHYRRERSRFLALDCKIRDQFQCQVCKMRFSEVYGSELGNDFAEAHHIVPLGKLSDRVKTRIEDLITVCANCHRMLHRMKGEKGDIAKLRRLVAQRARSRLSSLDSSE